jgi:hypothetical protein
MPLATLIQEGCVGRHLAVFQCTHNHSHAKFKFRELLDTPRICLEKHTFKNVTNLVPKNRYRYLWYVNEGLPYSYQKKHLMRRPILSLKHLKTTYIRV